MASQMVLVNSEIQLDLSSSLSRFTVSALRYSVVSPGSIFNTSVGNCCWWVKE